MIEALARLVTSRLGLRPSGRSSEIELVARVEARRAALGLASADEYVRRVMLAPEPELAHLAPAFTNGWTWFFRDHEAIEGLVTRLARMGLGRPAHVWVAGCSSGEEAFGVAIACAEGALDARVLATDVDALRLEVAARAAYDTNARRRVPAGVLARHFEPENSLHRIATPIRERVELRVHNLLDPAPPAPSPGGWDAIVCRNVLLHCTDEACAAITANLERALAPHGVLLLGPGDLQLRTASRGSPRARSAPPPRPLAVRPTPLPERPASAFPPPPPAPPAVRAPMIDEWSHALAALRAGEHGRARAALEALLVTSPRHVDAWMTLGNLRLAVHALEPAADAYDRAGVLEPDCAELHFLWGALHRKRGAWAAAAAALRRALFHDPDLWPARFLLAGAWERLGDDESARRAWSETLRSLARRPQIRWRSQVDDIEGLACPAEHVRTLGEERARRDGQTNGG